MKNLLWLILPIYLAECSLLNRALASQRKLERLLQNAQAHYFSGSPATETQKAFEAIVRRTDLLDAHPDTQDVFYFSFLRRAQLAVNEQDQENWMRRALIFDWNKSPDRQLFSPEFREKYSDLKTKLRFHHLRCSDFKLELEPLFLNGRPVQCHQDRFKIPRSPHLIWAKASPSSKIMRAETPEKLRPSEEKSLEVTLPNLADSEASTSGGDPKSTARLGLEELTPEISWTDQQASLIEKNQGGVTSFESTAAKKKSSFLRNKWLWIGLGVITTGVLISQSQRSSSPEPRTRPSTREGL